MKPRILNSGILANHDRLSRLSSFADPVAISDYDAFCFDPDAFAREIITNSTIIGPAAYQSRSDDNGYQIRNAVLRRRTEVNSLLTKKGGIVVCLLRPSNIYFDAFAEGRHLEFNKYAYISTFSSELDTAIARIQEGSGQSLKILNSSAGVAHIYLQILKGHLSFHASFAPWPSAIDSRTILAENSIGNPIAVEFEISGGKVCFLPVATEVPGERLGAAIVQTVDRFFAGDIGMPEPNWADVITVPGTERYNPKISDLENTLDEIAHEIQTLKGERQRLNDFKKLLYGYGMGVLEPAVRAAFRQFGLAVPEPDEYPQDWDAFLTCNDGRTAIVEVEGSEGIVDVRKYRQLLDYVDAEVQEGRTHKGVLVGNGYRLLPLDAPERKSQFSEHVLRGADRNEFCLVPTTELFKAVCAVLGNPNNTELKKQICDSLFSVKGIWEFIK